MSQPRKRYPRITPAVLNRQYPSRSSDRHALALKAQEFARRLEELMDSKGMTQSDLAKAAFGVRTDKYGVVQTAGRDRISAYVNGRQFPDEENLVKLANALGVTRDELTPDMEKLVAELEENNTPPEFDIKQIPNSADVYFEMRKRMTLDLAYQIIGLMVSQPDKITGRPQPTSHRASADWRGIEHSFEAGEEYEDGTDELYAVDDLLDLPNHIPNR